MISSLVHSIKLIPLRHMKIGFFDETIKYSNSTILEYYGDEKLIKIFLPDRDRNELPNIRLVIRVSPLF